MKPYEVTWTDNREPCQLRFATLEEARSMAKMLADVKRGRSFYCGQIGRDGRDGERFRYDSQQDRVIPYACND